jgi:acetyl esterase/lipase
VEDHLSGIRTYITRLLTAGLLLGSLAVHAADGLIDFPAVAPNVPYDDVAALPYRPANHRLVYGEDPLQYALLWNPVLAVDASPKALIVLIHGGCWLNAYDITHTFPLSTALSQEGYAVFSLEYRRTGDSGGGWPGTFDDIRAGIAYAKALQENDLNPLPVIAIGHSAGGHLALLAGAADASLQGVIGLAAITDIIAYAQGQNSCEVATPEFMGGDFASRAAQYHAANPAEQVPHHNTFLLQGSADSIVAPTQATIPGALAITQEGAGHFDWVHPGSEAFATLLSALSAALP